MTVLQVSTDPDTYQNLPFPPLPQTQGHKCATFKLPPLDGSLSVPEIYDWHAEHSSEHPLFEFAEDDGTVQAITWKEGNKGVHRAGWYTKRLLDEGQSVGSGSGERPIVAILASADFITYFTLLVGIIRAGYSAFFISPRNSAGAVAHLLTKSGSSYLFVGVEENLQNVAQTALKLVQGQNETLEGREALKLPKLLRMPVFEDLYPRFGGNMVEEDEFVYLPKMVYKMDDLAIMSHSSGSTAYPKPIRFTHYRYLALCFAPFFGEMDKTGLRMSTHSIPFFHGMGMIQTAWTASCGVILNALRPRTPSMPITSETVLKGFAATKSDIIFCVPTFVEDWARDPEAVEILQKTKGVFFGGGPLSKAVGDELTDKGIDIYNTYGIGECGIMSPFYPERLDKEWEYFRFTSNITPHFVRDESGYSEAFILPNKYHLPNVLNAMVDVDGEKRAAYSTSDYLEPHPTKPGYWKIIDRVDNQIIHSTGEKTNPGPLESILHHDPHVEAAVMFGRGRFNAGIIVDPREQYKFDPNDQEKLIEFRETIWPSIEKANEYAPQHSRIFKEMILVSKPDKPFDYTAKFTVRRQAMITLYEPEIEALYQSVDETSLTGLHPPSKWDLPNTLDFIRKVITTVVKGELSDEDDLFHRGCDSLQATWIRNSVLHALRNSASDVNVRQLPANFVYHHPSISRLASYIHSVASTGDVTGDALPEANDPVQAMLRLAERYSQDFPTHKPSSSTSPSNALDVVLVTGTTGGLGASLLSTLVRSEQVAKVYALNRKPRNGKSLVDRQKDVLVERGIDTGLLNSPKVVLLEADLVDDYLGLSKELYDEILGNVTHILHTAYHVDWKVTLESFEPQVHAFRNLINLSLSSNHVHPPKVLFTSSIGVLRNDPVLSSGRALEALVPPQSALGFGYGESKWVCERVAASVAEKTTLRPVIVRIGQIAGSSSGAWKPSEWVPSIIKSSIHLGALPTEDKEISWIGAEDTAQVIADLRNAGSINATPYIAHLAHSRPVQASTVIEPLSKILGISVVPFARWVQILEKSANDSSAEEKNPALKIIDFFRERALGSADQNSEAYGVVRMDITNALSGSRTLREDVKEVSVGDATAWVSYWRKVGHL